VARKQRPESLDEMKVSFVVKREENAELLRWLLSLPPGKTSRGVRERLERSLRRDKAKRATGATGRRPPRRFSPAREPVPAARPALASCPAPAQAHPAVAPEQPRPPMPCESLAGASQGDERVHDTDQILLEMDSTF